MTTLGTCCTNRRLARLSRLMLANMKSQVRSWRSWKRTQGLSCAIFSAPTSTMTTSEETKSGSKQGAPRWQFTAVRKSGRRYMDWKRKTRWGTCKHWLLATFVSRAWRHQGTHQTTARLLWLTLLQTASKFHFYSAATRCSTPDADGFSVELPHNSCKVWRSWWACQMRP